jgi:hypothetical protein
MKIIYLLCVLAATLQHTEAGIITKMIKMPFKMVGKGLGMLI